MGHVLPELEVSQLVGLVDYVDIVLIIYHGAVAPKPVHIL